MIGEPLGAGLSPGGEASGGNEATGERGDGYCERGRGEQAPRDGHDSQEIFP